MARPCESYRTISIKAPDRLHIVSKHHELTASIVLITDLFRGLIMARMLPDPTFYPSPKMAGEAPAESLAYVALLTNGQNG